MSGEPQPWNDYYGDRLVHINEDSSVTLKDVVVCPGCGRTYYKDGPMDRDHSLCGSGVPGDEAFPGNDPGTVRPNKPTEGTAIQQIKTIEYYENGMIKRVEYMT